MLSFFWVLSLLKRLGWRSELYEQMNIIRLSGLFDFAWYSRNASIVERAFRDPMVHYIRHGASLGRDPHPLFDAKFYERRSRLKTQHLNPLIYYQSLGSVADMDTCRWFNSAWYRSQCPGSLEFKRHSPPRFLSLRL